jgi:glycerophosphoryl diester phosphodiesterase
VSDRREFHDLASPGTAHEMIASLDLEGGEAGVQREAAHDRGLRVVPWTVNKRDDMRRLIRLGVDGLITDYPDVAQEVRQAVNESSD